jgi:ribosomal-protein-alanine N-acetyltransferase
MLDAEKPEVRVRLMKADDITGVAALAAQEATAPHWPLAEYRRMLEVIAESPGRRSAWVLLLAAPHEDLGDGRRVSSLGGAVKLAPAPTPTVPAGGPIIGFAMASHVAGTCELEAVVVQSAWRGRQFGAALVEAVAAWGEAIGASRLELEVRASNAAALRLYQRLGFAIDGRRPGYYRNPEEEAMLMSLALTLKEPGAGA